VTSVNNWGQSILSRPQDQEHLKDGVTDRSLHLAPILKVLRPGVDLFFVRLPYLGATFNLHLNRSSSKVLPVLFRFLSSFGLSTDLYSGHTEALQLGRWEGMQSGVSRSVGLEWPQINPSSLSDLARIVRKCQMRKIFPNIQAGTNNMEDFPLKQIVAVRFAAGNAELSLRLPATCRRSAATSRWSRMALACTATSGGSKPCHRLSSALGEQ
jgi:hypothetical protein